MIRKSRVISWQVVRIYKRDTGTPSKCEWPLGDLNETSENRYSSWNLILSNNVVFKIIKQKIFEI